MPTPLAIVIAIATILISISLLLMGIAMFLDQYEEYLSKREGRILKKKKAEQEIEELISTSASSRARDGSSG